LARYSSDLALGPMPAQVLLRACAGGSVRTIAPDTDTHCLLWPPTCGNGKD
jgi:hypothetical protein